MIENDLLSIKEFSDLTGINQSTLRYYDRIKLFQPQKRGENGYRYYSASQTVTVNWINVIRSLDIPIKRIIDIKCNRTPLQILDILQKHELYLNQELYRLQQSYALIHTYSNLMQEGLFADESAITVRYMEKTQIEPGPDNDFSSGYFYDSYFNYVKEMKEKKIDSVFPTGGLYDSMDAFSDAPGQPIRFFSLIPTGRGAKEAGQYMVGYARGYYGEPGDLPVRMKTYAKEHNLKFTGPVYEICVHDEISTADKNKYLIQASVRVRK